MANASEPLLLNRVVLSNELQPDIRLYRRLWLARIDLEEAKAAIEELLRLKPPLPRTSSPTGLLLSLTTAFVVAYARPFVNTRGRSIVAERTVPGSLLRVLTTNQRAFHDYLLQMRNREVAHSDADILEISLTLFPDGDAGISREARMPFRRTELRVVHRIIEKLEDEIERRCVALRNRLPLGIEL